MYDSIMRGDHIGDGCKPEQVLCHRGKREDVLPRHRQVAARAHLAGMRGIRELAPHLSKVIADPRMLRLAWDHLARYGGGASGTDGLTYSDFRDDEVWELCRTLGQAIRRGTYNRGPDRITKIPKGPRRGVRTLVISNVADRVVERAAASVLTPVLDPLFDDRSFGFRPGRGYQDALASAERVMIDQRRRVWVVDDLSDAFQHVPLQRLLQVLRKLLPDDSLIQLIDRILAGGELPGLRQGGPLSPLLLNVYLNHFLDRPWRRDQPNLPLIRFADDILVTCKDVGEARSARGHLEQILGAAAMPLKGTEESAIRVLDPKTPTNWIGVSLTKPPRGLAIRIGDSAWTSLDDQLALAHSKPASPIRAVQVIRGWLGQRGPCYQSSDRPEACRRIHEIAASQAFDEIPRPEELLSIWKAAERRWQVVRKATRETLRGINLRRYDAPESSLRRSGRSRADQSRIDVLFARRAWEVRPPKPDSG